MAESKPIKNPWTYEDLDDFLFYCCPQCDIKCKTKSLFVDHALLIHPESEEKMKVELKTLDNNTLVSIIPFKETQNNGELLEDFKMRIKSGIN